MKKVCILLGLFMLLTGSLEISEYTIHTNHKFVNGPILEPLQSTQLEYKPLPSSESHQFLISYRVEILHSHDAGGSRTFSVFVNDVEVPDCRFVFETIDQSGFSSQVLLFNPMGGNCFMEREFSTPETKNYTVEIREINRTGTLGTVYSWNSDITVTTQEITGMSTFETVIGTSALEFLTIMGLFLALWWVFYTTKDIYIMLFTSFIMEVVGIIWLWMFIESSVFLHLMLTFITFFMGAYLFLRTIIQEMLLKVKL